MFAAAFMDSIEPVPIILCSAPPTPRTSHSMIRRWYNTDINENLTAGVIVFTGQTSFTGLGGMLREKVYKEGRLTLAVEAQGFL